MSEFQAFPLNQTNISSLKVDKQHQPIYSRGVNDSVKRICHVGVGQFHRSHQAYYLHKLLNYQSNLVGSSQAMDWQITGIGLLPYDLVMKNKLQEQDYLYTVLTLGQDKREVEVVGSITDFYVKEAGVKESSTKIIECLADVNTKIVSLTITEHGYLQNHLSDLDFTNAKVLHDLSNPTDFQTIYGLVYSALKLRKERGLPSFTILSCDNLPCNGKLTQRLISQFITHMDDKETLEYMHQHTLFPSTMVDRITPKTSDEHMEILQNEFSIKDQWPVAAEDFIQWIIEDKFVNNERPAFDLLMQEDGDYNVVFADDVVKYEECKLFLLNAGHSSLAYVGLLNNIEIVDQAMQHPQVRDIVFNYMNEAKFAVSDDIPGINKEQYIAKLIARFSNPFIKDRTERLASQGHAKMQNFVLPALTHLLAHNKAHPDNLHSVKAIAKMIASWIVFLGTFGVRHQYVVDDAKAEELLPFAKQIFEANDDATQQSAKLLAFMEVGIPQLVHENDFLAEIQASLKEF